MQLPLWGLTEYIWGPGYIPVGSRHWSSVFSLQFRFIYKNCTMSRAEGILAGNRFFGLQHPGHSVILLPHPQNVSAAFFQCQPLCFQLLPLFFFWCLLLLVCLFLYVLFSLPPLPHAPNTRSQYLHHCILVFWGQTP